MLITKARARARGLAFYFTGKPCSRGHVAERRVSNSTCVLCARLHARNWEAADPKRKEAAMKRLQDWIAADPERARSAAAIRYARWAARNAG